MGEFLRSSEWVDLGCGPGVVHLHSAQQWIESEPIRFGGQVEIVVAGRYDALVVERCGTLSLVDNKTSNKDEASLLRYRRQLAAYTFALEHPARGLPLQINEAGLWVLSPTAFATRPHRMGLYGPARWIAMPRIDHAFQKLLGAVADILTEAEPPTIGRCD